MHHNQKAFDATVELTKAALNTDAIVNEAFGNSVAVFMSIIFAKLVELDDESRKPKS